MPAEVAALLGTAVEPLLAIPEHKVVLPGGGASSQCDVFALVRAGAETVAVAVEAKVDEPFGPTVREWLVDASAGKLARMRFICETLGLGEEPPGDMRYQLLHRTVAVVVEAERYKTDRAAMVVHSFSAVNRWFEDFGSFADLLGFRAEPSVGSTVELPSGLPLTLGWAVGSSTFL